MSTSNSEHIPTPISRIPPDAVDAGKARSAPNGCGVMRREELQNETRIVAKRLCSFLEWHPRSNPPDAIIDQVVEYYGDDIRLAILLAPSHRTGCTTGFRAALTCFIVNANHDSEDLDHLADIAQVVNGGRKPNVARLSGRCDALLDEFIDCLAKPPEAAKGTPREKFRFALSMVVIDMYLKGKTLHDLRYGDFLNFDPTKIPVPMLRPFDGAAPEAVTH